jgi:hypothetical protein
VQVIAAADTGVADVLGAASLVVSPSALEVLESKAADAKRDGGAS